MDRYEDYHYIYERQKYGDGIANHSRKLISEVYVIV